MANLVVVDPVFKAHTQECDYQAKSAPTTTRQSFSSAVASFFST
jgi:hypothetical protein